MKVKYLYAWTVFVRLISKKNTGNATLSSVAAFLKNREWALTDTCPQHRLCINTAVSSPSFSRLGFRGGLLPGKARISVALTPATLDCAALALLNREQNAGQSRMVIL